MLERLKQVKKKWFIPLVFILIGVSFVLPYYIQQFILWAIQKPLLEVLLVLGLCCLVAGACSFYAVVMTNQ